MNAANASLQASALENERRAHEPSMEEILASIRKIIADDDALPLTRPVAEPRSTFSTPKPFDKPFETAFAQPLETNVTPLSMRPAFAPEPPEPMVAEEQETPVSAAVSSGTALEDATIGLSGIELADDAATVATLNHEVDLHDAELQEIDLQEVDLQDEPETRAVAFGATVLPTSPEDDDLASLAEIASELSAHDLLPAIADESPHDILAEIRATSGEPADVPQAVTPPPIPASAEAVAEAAMLSPETDASVSSAFRALSASVQLASAETIDRQVRELLRPMLKQWLDDNLPVMVERLVRAEIERVARGGR